MIAFTVEGYITTVRPQKDLDGIQKITVYKKNVVFEYYTIRVQIAHDERGHYPQKLCFPYCRPRIEGAPPPFAEYAGKWKLMRFNVRIFAVRKGYLRYNELRLANPPEPIEPC